MMVRNGGDASDWTRAPSQTSGADSHLAYARGQRRLSDAPRLSASLERRAWRLEESDAGSYWTLYLLECHRGAIEILTYLDREGRGTVTEMRRHLVPGAEAVRGALSALERLGLIEAQRSGHLPFARVYRLTDKGRNLLSRPVRELSRVLSAGSPR